MITTFLLANWRLIVFAALLAGAAGWGAYRMHEHDVAKYEKLEQEFTQFKFDVKARGEAQERETARTLARQKSISQAKENEDAQLIADITARNAAVFERLRQRATDPGSGVVPAVPTTPGVPAGQACFDRDKLNAGLSASLGVLLSRLAPILQRCDVAAGELELARQWSQEQLRANPPN